MRTRWQATFASLAVPNYKRYTQGQLVSLIGTWMQSTGQAWLVLNLTGSGTRLGLVIALQTLPILLLGPYAGVLIDRVDKRRAMELTQGVMGLLSALVAVLVLTHSIEVWQLYAVALVFGIANSVANPARQTFVLEMVGPEYLRNAVTLNTVLVNVARAVGPAVAGVLIETAGVGWCFVIDALSYVVVLATLATLDATQLHPADHVGRAKGQLREGLSYVASTPALLVPLLMMGVVGMLTYEFQVSLPLVARYTFNGGATAYGLMTGAMGVGAVVGGLAAAGRTRSGPRTLARTALLFGAVTAGAALAPYLWLEIVVLAFVGAASVTFLSLGNTTLQLTADPRMRGRVMALWSVAFLGSTPVGGPIVGAVGEHLGPRWSLAIGAVAALGAGVVGLLVVRRSRAVTSVSMGPAETPATREVATMAR